MKVRFLGALASEGTCESEVPRSTCIRVLMSEDVLSYEVARC